MRFSSHLPMLAILAAPFAAADTGGFTIVGKMVVNHGGGYSTTLLSDGRVLIAGGWGTTFSPLLAIAEIFDPTTGTFTLTGSMNEARTGHTATLLSDGRVLIAGGVGEEAFDNEDANMLTSAELYNPNTGTFSYTGSLPAAYSFGISATILQDGRVLVAGGTSIVVEGTVVNQAFGPVGGVATIYDPDAEKFISAGRIPMVNPIAAPLQDGRVLLVGGNPTLTDNVALLFDPGANAFTPVSTSAHSIFPNQAANAVTSGFAAAPLADGNVLLVGGYDAKGQYSRDTAEIFDVGTETFSATGRLPIPCSFLTAVSLAGGRVLVGMYRTSALYDPQSGTFIDLGLPGLNGNSTVLLDGTVLITGAVSYSGDVGVYAPLPQALSSASSTTLVAPQSLASIYGSGFAQSTSGANLESPPTALAGVTVTVYDSTHTPRLAPLLYVSPSQVNLEIPAGTVPGTATLLIANTQYPSGTQYINVPVEVRAVAPSIFTLPGRLAIAPADGENADGSIAIYPPGASITPAPPVVMYLYCTGVRGASSLSGVTVTVGGIPANVTYAGPQSPTAGLDQVTVTLPPSLNATGLVPLQLTVDGMPANPVFLKIAAR